MMWSAELHYIQLFVTDKVQPVESPVRWAWISFSVFDSQQVLNLPIRRIFHNKYFSYSLCQAVCAVDSGPLIFLGRKT